MTRCQLAGVSTCVVLFGLTAAASEGPTAQESRAEEIRRPHRNTMRVEIAARDDSPPIPAHIRAAEELTRQAPVPAERLAPYEWLKKHPEIRLRGWRGMVQEVRDTPEGTLARITITPDLDSVKDGLILVGHLEETYRRTDAGWVHVEGRTGEPRVLEILINP